MSRVGFADETRKRFLMESDASLLLKVRLRSNLLRAWLRVRANGMQSESARTRREVEVFADEAELNLSRLYRKLQRGKFAFSKAIGVPLQRPGKSPRPIVIASVEDRIVQRSILNVVQKIESVSQYVKLPTSFGGIERRGVPQAIEYLIRRIQEDGFSYYARSDILNFFQGIPKDTVIQKLRDLIGEHPAFLKFIREAMDVELRNLDELGAHWSLFPSRSIGVAQGGCLSPLLGNMLLHDFDIQLNGRGIACFRYIDDFIILGKDRTSVMKAYKSAHALLAKHGLSAHEPEPGSTKASAGTISDGFEFLGCKVIPGLISPNSKSRQRLLQNIRSRFDQSKRYLRICEQARRHDLSFVKTMLDVNYSLLNWGNQYSFCNDKTALATLQTEVNALVYDYLSFFRATVRTTNETQLFRSLGMHLLLESNSKPIKWHLPASPSHQSGAPKT